MCVERRPRHPDRGRDRRLRPALGQHPRATASLSGVIDVGRPPTLPRARAAANPARVRSRIRSRSNAARDARTPNSSRPAGVVVSIASVSDANPTPRSSSAVDRLDQVRRRAAEPVEPPHHERVARAQLLEYRRQLRPLGQRARGLIREDPLDPRRLQRVVLQRRILLEGRDPRVAEPVARAGSESVMARLYRNSSGAVGQRGEVSDTSFRHSGTPARRVQRRSVWKTIVVRQSSAYGGSPQAEGCVESLGRSADGRRGGRTAGRVTVSGEGQPAVGGARRMPRMTEPWKVRVATVSHAATRPT